MGKERVNMKTSILLSVMELMEGKRGRRERNSLGKQALRKVSDHMQVKQYCISSKV